MQSHRLGDCHYLHWKLEQPQAAVVIIHGYADHAGRFTHVGEYLSHKGIEVYALDLRGHGHSSGRRGHINSFGEYHTDARDMLEQVRAESSAPGIYVLGHSMGGLVALSSLIHDPVPLDGVLLSAPFLGMGMPVPSSKVALAKLISKVWPTLTMANNIPASFLSRDEAVGRAYLADPLVFQTATARWFTETMSAIEAVIARADEFKYPCLFMQAGDERIADAATAKRIFKALGSDDKTYIEYSGFYHEILNEIGKEQVLDDILRWIGSPPK